MLMSSLDFKSVKDKISRYGSLIRGNEATKLTFVLPFIQTLGYDVFNPTEVVTPYTFGNSDNRICSIDYALCIEDEPAIAIQTVAFGESLDESCSRLSVLKDCLMSTSIQIGLFTDGNTYRVYCFDAGTKKVSLGSEFCLSTSKSEDLGYLSYLHRIKFNSQSAEQLRIYFMYNNLLTQYFSKQISDASDSFCTFIGGELSIKPDSQKVFSSYLKSFMKSNLYCGNVSEGDERHNSDDDLDWCDEYDSF